MRFVIRILQCFSVIIILQGCQTGYGSKGLFGRGYSDEKMDENQYKVNFTGNYITPLPSVIEGANRRAQELCEEGGYKGFKVIEKKTTAKDFAFDHDMTCSGSSESGFVCDKQQKKKSYSHSIIINCT